MRKTLILLAAGTAAIAGPAFAQLGSTAGQVTGHVTGNVTGQVDPAGTVGNVTDQVTQPVGEVVDQVDQTANDAVDATDLTLATQDQVRAGANVTDMDGNSIGTVQGIDGGNAVVVSGGKLYNVPLSALYAHGTDTAKGLVSKVPQAQLEAHAGADASADTDAEADPGSR